MTITLEHVVANVNLHPAQLAAVVREFVEYFNRNHVHEHELEMRLVTSQSPFEKIESSSWMKVLTNGSLETDPEAVDRPR